MNRLFEITNREDLVFPDVGPGGWGVAKGSKCFTLQEGGEEIPVYSYDFSFPEGELSEGSRLVFVKGAITIGGPDNEHGRDLLEFLQRLPEPGTLYVGLVREDYSTEVTGEGYARVRFSFDLGEFQYYGHA